MVIGSMDQANDFQARGYVWSTISGAAEVLDLDPGQTEQQVRQVLKNIPGQQHSLMLLVSALRAKGDTDGARAMLESLSLEQPDLAAVHYELGLLLGELGERDAAIRALSRVVELEPKHPTAWRALGDELAESGDAEGAAKAYAKQFESSVMDLKMLENMMALELDKIEIAGTMVREFLNIHPTDVTAIHMLGQVYARGNQFDAAEKMFSRALELAPGFTAARLDILSALRHQMKWDEETRQLDILLELEPAHAGYRYLKAVSLARGGKLPESVAYCEAILGDDPKQARFWMAYAYALRTVARHEDCVAAFRKSVALEPGLGESWWGLANLKTFRFSPTDIETMRSQLARDDLEKDDRCHLHFALGKALEDTETYDESFEQYRLGNALERAQYPYDADEMGKNVQRVKAQFTRDFFLSRAGLGCPSPAPIFIVGLPRAGSTLIEQILSSHSSVEGGGELPAINAIAARLEAMDRAGEASERTESLRALESQDLKLLGERYLERVQSARKLARPFFTDKMPHNFHHLGLICAILPHAKIIDVRRHPLACCFSNFKQIFPSGRGPSYDLADIGRYYRDYVELMAHFDEVLPGRIHRVFYEDVVRDPEGEIRRLLEYCALPYEEACLHFHETDRSIFTASSEQVRLPVYTDSLEQWRHYDRWLGPLKTALGPVLDLYPAIPGKL
ncbi:MAG TPA: sulfotransferase [Rhizomicrobium sp.]